MGRRHGSKDTLHLQIPGDLYLLSSQILERRFSTFEDTMKEIGLAGLDK